MNGATEFLATAAKPLQFFLGDAVVLRLCRAAHYAKWARERHGFQQLCGDRLGIVLASDLVQSTAIGRNEVLPPGEKMARIR